jgi:hypothetical protein
VAQLVEHHLAKVRVAGSNPVVRSEVPEAVSRADGPLGSSVPARLPGGSACGGMAEWFRQGPAKPCTRVRFPLPPRGRLAQRESASLTRKRSLVQSQYRPPVQPQISEYLIDSPGNDSGDYRPRECLRADLIRVVVHHVRSAGTSLSAGHDWCRRAARMSLRPGDLACAPGVRPGAGSRVRHCP